MANIYPSLSRYAGFIEDDDDDDDNDYLEEEEAHEEQPHEDTEIDSGTDYGSDFTPDEEYTLSQLVSSIQQQSQQQQQQRASLLHDIEDLPPTRPALLSPSLGTIADDSSSLDDNESTTTSILPRSSRSHSPPDAATAAEAPRATGPPAAAAAATTTPLLRFRTAPQKPLSVTDLISPAWCELQYWYSLTHHGRKRRTPAMKRGSAVHRALEAQVHTAVAVATTTREDAWALRLWNVIQGLRALRETGLTRELEVWGVLEGEVVVGVIDQLSFTCPDDELAAKEEAAAGGEAQARQQKVYITDIKTRAAANVPHGASFRPTLLQLMLYQHLLTHLPALDPTALFARYRLSPSAPFSDVLLAQVAALPGYGEICASPPGSPSGEAEELYTTAPTSPDPLGVVLAHNSLTALFKLMQRELRLTLPAGGVSRVLAAEYRSSAAGGEGAVTGVKTFLSDARVLGRWTRDALSWWRGERAAHGVVVEEAWKCRRCEFSEACEWRAAKVSEGLRRGRGGKEGE